MANGLVLGGGVCGLGTARRLARGGHEGSVVERDADPAPAAPRADLLRAPLEHVATITPIHEILARPDVGARIPAALASLCGAPFLELVG